MNLFTTFQVLTERLATLESIINCEGNTESRDVYDGNEPYQSDETTQMLSPPQDYPPSAPAPDCRDISCAVGQSPFNAPITSMTPPDDEISDLIEADL